jgi:hypothetical protein
MTAVTPGFGRKFADSATYPFSRPLRSGTQVLPSDLKEFSLDWDALKDAVAASLAPLFFTVLFVFALWSNYPSGRKMARKWGVPEPTDEQVEEVFRYRRLRLASYPVLLVVCAGAVEVSQRNQHDQDDQDGALVLVLMFLLGSVIADVVALLRAKRALPPTRLRLFDLVPRWGVVWYGLLVLATVVSGLVDLQAQPHITPELLRTVRDSNSNDEIGVPIIVPLIGTPLVMLCVAFVLWFAKARSYSADDSVDRALRTRSARVVLGLAMAMQAVLISASSWRMRFVSNYAEAADPNQVTPAESAVRTWAERTMDLVEPWTSVLGVLTFFCWISMANPVTRTPAKSGRR